MNATYDANRNSRSCGRLSDDVAVTDLQFSSRLNGLAYEDEQFTITSVDLPKKTSLLPPWSLGVLFGLAMTARARLLALSLSTGAAVRSLRTSCTCLSNTRWANGPTASARTGRARARIDVATRLCA